MIGFLKKSDCTVQINPGGASLTVSPGETILQAALDQGISFPHNCRVGSCATCKCRLVSGRVKELSDSGYVLSGEEIKSGMILACQALPVSDAVIEVNLEE